MLLTNVITDQETKRWRTLSKVYALLIRLADYENTTAHPENFVEDTGQAAKRKAPNSQGKESDHE